MATNSFVEDDDGEDEPAAPLRQRLYASFYRIRYGWSFKSSAAFGDDAIWLLGEVYHPDKDLDANVGREGVPLHVADFLKHFRSLTWMTYRTNFPPLCNGPMVYTSDCGWGCMIRSGQMLLATALHYHMGLRGWRFSSPAANDDSAEMRKHRMILSWFLDDLDHSRPFSLHSLMKHAGRLGDHKPGDWFGPSQVALLIREALLECLTTHAPDCSTLNVYVAHDCTVYVADIQKLFAQENHSVLLLVPIRLGSDVFNHIYIPCVKAMLTLNQCVGIIGGKPRHSVYFVGHEANNLIHLDPHFSQAATSPSGTFNLHSYHCKAPRKFSASKMDPSCTIGFYCKDMEDFNLLRKHAEPMLAPPQQQAMYPFFTFSDGHLGAMLDCTAGMQFRTASGGVSSEDSILDYHDEDFIVIDCKVHSDLKDK